MNTSELIALKKAARKMATVNDTFLISGHDFSCRWNGSEFIWTPPSGNSFTATARQVCRWIGDGSGILENYCFSYGD